MVNVLNPWFMGVFLVVAPAVMATVGFVLLFNVRGVADYLYLRFEGRMVAVGGGISPRMLRGFGALFTFFGTIGFMVQIVSRTR